MANDYEKFQEIYTKFSAYVEGAKSAYAGKMSPELKDLAASTSDDERFQAYMRNTRNPTELLTVLNESANITKERINAHTSGKLEQLVDGMPKMDLALGLSIVNPKDKYFGANADLYADISKLKKDSTSMNEVLQSEDTDKMTKYVKDFYKNKYSAPDKADQLRIVNALIAVGGGFAEYVYSVDAQEKQKAFSEKLSGNEKGYLTANLEGVDFTEFYTALQETKEQFERQQKWAKERKSSPQNPRRRRVA
ncbi:MAG: hypothetical protein AABW67_05580 [Nanoarchaeota archaeon]